MQPSNPMTDTQLEELALSTMRKMGWSRPEANQCSETAILLAALKSVAQAGADTLSSEERGAVLTVLKVAEKALHGFAKIEMPVGSPPGAWVAKTIHCNDMVTAVQVVRAQCAMQLVTDLHDRLSATDA